MEFKHLQSFAAVVRYGSFTRAAEKLYLSQPTISAHIQALEAELNKRLIIRTTKSFEVTAKGRMVYEYAVNILDLKERMLQSCSDEGQKIIHLGASTIPSAYILPEILPEFGKRYPEIYFVIHQTDSQGVMDGLADGIFDVGLIGMKTDQLTCIPFCEDRMVMITPVNEHFLQKKEQEGEVFKELLQEPIILREKGSGSSKSADRFLEYVGIREEQLQVMARINDQEAIKNMVAGGLGVSIISARAAQNFVKEKRVLQFELPYHNRRSLYLAYRKDYILKSYVQEFVRFTCRKYTKNQKPERVSKGKRE